MLELTSGIFPIDITDHMPIFIKFPVVSANRGEYSIKSASDYYSKGYLELFERSLRNYVDVLDVGMIATDENI